MGTIDSPDNMVVVNDSGLSDGYVAERLPEALAGWRGMESVKDALDTWSRRLRPTPTLTRRGGLLERDQWLRPGSPFELMRVCRRAVRDDVVGGAADGTESLAFKEMSIFSDDEDEENIWNQVAGDIDLDGYFRKAWRLLYTDSQFVSAAWWQTASYPVQGRTKAGNKRRSQFENMQVPTALTFLDTTKVAPVGNLYFGQEKLAYVADPYEALHIEQVLANRDGHPVPSATSETWRGRRKRRILSDVELNLVELEDPFVSSLFRGRYQPDHLERRDLEADGIDCTNLFLLHPQNVWRHTLTRPDFQRFSDVRLESVLELLDIKGHLKQMDRVNLMGGANFIVLLTKGTDQRPVEDQKEIDNLHAHAATLGQNPVIVGDHRLNIKIVAPPVEITLNRGRYDTVNSALFTRCWQTFVPTGADQDDPTKLGQVICQGLETRRRMMRRTFELRVIDEIRRRNGFKERATLVFHPRTISLAFDQARASFLLDLRQANEISRHTTLAQVDLNQAQEARWRERERDKYDDTFETLNPHGPQPGGGGGDGTGPPAPGRLATRSGGRRGGGLRNGGGAARPGDGQGQPPRNPRRTADELAALGKRELVEIARDLEIPGRARMNCAGLVEAIVEAIVYEPDEEEDDL